ncbi:hypothetical protein Q3G72_034855 [Acer saccharum]|nr:hypothetical protein Q3G72_034855 [Acer saccharum]
MMMMMMILKLAMDGGGDDDSRVDSGVCEMVAMVVMMMMMILKLAVDSGGGDDSGTPHHHLHLPRYFYHPNPNIINNSHQTLAAATTTTTTQKPNPSCRRSLSLPSHLFSPSATEMGLGQSIWTRSRSVTVDLHPRHKSHGFRAKNPPERWR